MRKLSLLSILICLLMMTIEMMIAKMILIAPIVMTILPKLAFKKNCLLLKSMLLTRSKRLKSPTRILSEFTQIATMRIQSSSLGTRHT